MPSFDLPPLLCSSAFPVGSRERRGLDRRAASGQLVRIWPGVFSTDADWGRLGPTQKQVQTVRAALPRMHRRMVVSHLTALALYRVSPLHPWSPVVHVTDPAGVRGERRGRVARHPGPLPAIRIGEVDGVRVTTVAQTVVDIAITEPFEVAVAAADACLARGLVTREQLMSLVDEYRGRRGGSSASRVVVFSNAKSDSAGESWCRCRLAELGVTRLIQQQKFSDAFGLIGLVDFWLPEFGVVVEFDGDMKHLDPAYRRGQTAEQSILRERKRERRLLALPEVREVVRVEWRDLVEPWRLRTKLVAAGVPC